VEKSKITNYIISIMRRDDVVKRLEKMGYKVTYLFNGKLMVLSKKWTRVYNSANEAYKCLIKNQQV
jgi:hypothetical protein